MMMRRATLLFAGLTALASVTATAHAQTLPDSGAVLLRFEGDADPACVISAASAATASNATLATGESATQVNIASFVDPRTAQSSGATIRVSLPVVCNYAHRVRVRSGQGGLRVEENGVQPASAGFATLAPYSLQASFNGIVQSVTTTAPGSGVTIVNAEGAVGALDLSITIPQGGPPLVAGSYVDQLIIDFEAAS